jgi:hypothetical protein
MSLGQQEQETYAHQGHMDHAHHHIKIETYENEADRLAHLAKIYAEIHQSGEYSASRPEVFRTPGTFLLEVATGLLTVNQVLEMVTSHPDAICSAECMDERMNHAAKDGKHVLTSHDGCGAAGVVAGLINKEAPTYNQVSYDRMAAFLGEALPSLVQQLQKGMSADLVGQVWSKALVEKANAYAQSQGKDAQFEYKHLSVDHDHHYASMSVVDAAGEFMAPTPGKVGDRPFIISNPDHLKLENKEQSYKIMAEWAVLSIVIAWGVHSAIKDRNDIEYQVVVVVSPDTRKEDEALFNRYFRAAYRAKLANFGEHKDPHISFVTAEELSSR